jgi:prolyl-tRNA editing enzyme YbaK/EbsC (Cys-tRNA(Pro) deacylase)
VTERLDFQPCLDHLDLVGGPVAAGLQALPPDVAATVRVAVIDPDLADTAAFCAAYGFASDASANCVVVTGKREGVERSAACVVLATTRADVNNTVRRHLDVRKISFARLDDAVRMTGMEYGGITAIGLPVDWPVLVDEAVLAAGEVLMGSGIRGSKLLLPATVLTALPGAQVLSGMARDAGPEHPAG